ncbi:CG4577 [Drosophila busckii]|uniref:CG4577 n=1 Tax=Drosophila busckii TaxID=30019 RepID=A0A0M5IW65_DROBS|nr:uncharacterized protein LOC108607635 [Drosophila busckii]ALC38581.1 CG4577 [Drosophila busckii]
MHLALSSSALALVLLLVAQTLAVPASVLAQNTELSTNANNKQQLQQQQQQQEQGDLPTAQRAEAATVPPADKKSSPEIVPASFSNAPAARNNEPRALPYALPSNDEILAAVAAAAQSSQQQLQEEPTALEEAVASSTMRKRGINYDYNPYVNVPSADYGSDMPSGIWSDDYEQAAQPSANYNYNNERDLQQLDDYAPERRVNNVAARNKAYDNLLSLLNAEAYLESIPLSVPLTYANRNYNLDERNKRGIYYNLANEDAEADNVNLNKYRRYSDLRLKRDATKLTPADMLALVALVEAGERARKDSDMEVPLVEAEDLDYLPAAGTWLDAPVQVQQPQQQAPALVDYYGMPVDAQVMSKYDYVPRQPKHQSGRTIYGSSKRFMVSKKKRSVNQSQYFKQPVAERGPSYNGEKYY